MSKILININNLEEICEYEKIGITNFLFAVKDFSVGYKSFALKDIPKNSYLLVNRVLDCDAVDNLLSLKKEILQFKGIIFEDLSVYNIFRNEDIELIWYQNHFATNYASINYYLNNGCESAIISNEITEEEILEILKKAKKPLVLCILGKNQIMYSRRTLLKNFNEHNGLCSYNDMVLKENGTSFEFLAHEDEFGTVLYNNEYFNYIPLISKLDDASVKFYLILNQDLTPLKIDAILKGESFGDAGFLNKKTVYRMSDYNDR